jgi:hypothetical protein
MSPLNRWNVMNPIAGFTSTSPISCGRTITVCAVTSAARQSRHSKSHLHSRIKASFTMCAPGVTSTR